VASGHGAAFLLLHGWASDSSVWALMTPRLQELGPVIAVDAPGSGLSTRGRETFTYARYADAAAAVMEQEGLSSAVVVAHSFGAYAARELVRQYPERACAIVLVDGSFGRSFHDAAATRAFRESLSAQPWPDPLKARNAPSNASPDTLRLLPIMHARVSRETAVEWINALLDERIYESDRVSAPVRLILRAESTWMTAEEIDRLRAYAPRLQVVRVARVSHFLAWDAPDAVAALIREFTRTADCAHAAQ
jgi:pimeloyl-ACP methyl ester carboxylesterase